MIHSVFSSKHQYYFEDLLQDILEEAYLVEARYYHHPANFNGHPDNWYPNESYTEVEINGKELLISWDEVEDDMVEEMSYLIADCVGEEESHVSINYDGDDVHLILYFSLKAISHEGIILHYEDYE